LKLKLKKYIRGKEEDYTGKSKNKGSSNQSDYFDNKSENSDTFNNE